MKAGHPKNQHYVPQFLLSNFCTPGTELLFCYDKRSDRVFRTSVRNVASEKWFYDLADHETELSLEEPLADLEGRCAPIINGQILQRKTVRGLSVEERGWLAVFIAVQMLRTPHVRESARHMDTQLAKVLADMGANINNVENYAPIDSPEAAKEFSLVNMRSAKFFAPHILDKVWGLHESSSQFIISDNPISLHNEMNQSKFRGTLGLAVRGIEINLPLSPSYTLFLFCRDTYEDLASRFDRHHRILDNAGDFALRNFVNSIRRKLAIPCTSENVIHFNSLQVISAERFLFGPQDNFDLARDMIRKHPHLKEGPRMQVH